MNRPIRIGLIAEGEAELGLSIPYISPEEGGKVIDKDTEGALHTLVRRELESVGIQNCSFIQRHPTPREAGMYKIRTGHSIQHIAGIKILISKFVKPFARNNMHLC